MTHISKVLTAWTGSEKTEELVREQIRERWGDDEADNYNPRFSARPFRAWSKLGFKIKPNSKALRSFVVLKTEDKETGEIKKIFKTIFLFHTKQIELRK
jgi:hypothetical protein